MIIRNGSDSMLIDFTFKNVRSFKDEVMFSMEVGEGVYEYTNTNTMRMKGIDLIKSAFIFGGNASGKTNMIRAFQLLRQVVMHGTASELDLLPNDTYADNGGNTYFRIRFIKNEKLYDYMIEYNPAMIVNESLIVDDTIIFERHGDTIMMPAVIKELEPALRSNQPLLYFGQNNNVSEAKAAYEWFSLDIVMPSLLGNALQSQQLLLPLHKDAKLKEDVLYLLKSADFNIKDIITEEVTITMPYDEEKVSRVLMVRCAHQGEGNEVYKLDYEAESIGTRIFMLLAMIILQYKTTPKVFLIDEFDRSLHPKLVKNLFRIFNEWNGGRTQLIATTHNNDILEYPIRTDQIWFVDKNYYGVSSLTSAFDFNELENRDIKKNYQDGVYGSDQIINDAMMKDILGVHDILDNEEETHYGKTV